MDSVEIVTAGPDWMRAVAELRWHWAEEVHGPPPMALDEFVNRFTTWAAEHVDSHRCAVAVRDGRAVGMAWLAVLPRVPHPLAFERTSADVQCVYVVPEERSGGIGGRLIDAVLAKATEIAAERVTVHSSTRAVAAYRRHGFAVSPVLLQAVPGVPGNEGRSVRREAGGPDLG
ncbi:GNAT family N-acetyltransferase [Actinosynnema sp. NPDC023587]|uniref:GNAT family N-acetyltransferase n=1 Tax=Actinosynnema sp. NPDC023587 TaxID=3154695 RepID=UPI0033ECAAD1